MHKYKRPDDISELERAYQNGEGDLVYRRHAVTIVTRIDKEVKIARRNSDAARLAALREERKDLIRLVAHITQRAHAPELARFMGNDIKKRHQP